MRVTRVYEPKCVHLKTNAHFHVLLLFLCYYYLSFESAASFTLCLDSAFKKDLRKYLNDRHFFLNIRFLIISQLNICESRHVGSI